MPKMIVIPESGEIKSVKYEKFQDAHDAVGGYLTPMRSILYDEQPAEEYPDLEYDFLCDSDMAFKTADFSPLATLISGAPIFGIVVALKIVEVPYEEDGKIKFYEHDYTGFEDDEAEYMIKILKQFKEKKKTPLKELTDLWIQSAPVFK